MNLGAVHAGQAYILLGTATGTSPGQDFYGVPLALNRDGFFVWTLARAGGASLPGSVGVLDASGRATADYVASPAELALYGERRRDWAVVIGATPYYATAPVGFDVVP
jgi:hypothetical protein